jgi:hypothetical protein
VAKICGFFAGEPVKSDPCNPSPCGPNARCTVGPNGATCECLPGYFGSPYSGCRPECVLSADCPRDKACVRQKCVDPCPGVCGYSAKCNVVNHSPICTCPAPLTGDPFVECKNMPGNYKKSMKLWTDIDVFAFLCAEIRDPCNPSPCSVNGQCRVVNGAAACYYPECVINQDCARDKACFAQKCKDPCVDACGFNALCQVVNHNPVCSCPAGFMGSARVECKRQPQAVEGKTN